jgi:hypothetical protein
LDPWEMFRGGLLRVHPFSLFRGQEVINTDGRSKSVNLSVSNDPSRSKILP